MFKARYEGTCPACEDPINIGEEVTMIDSDRGRVTVHIPCAEDGVVISAASVGRPDHTALIPRGKTARDICGGCFQIPSSNGVCGCTE